MEISKRDFKSYIVNEYIPTKLETKFNEENRYIAGAHYVSINWRRFYFTLKHFLQNYSEDTERILDIGSFPGSVLRLMREYLKVDTEIYSTGLKFGKEYLDYMTKYGVECGEVDIDPPFYEIENHPFPFVFTWDDNYFDIVLACEIFEHLVNPLHLIREVRRVLKPGGVFILTTPNQSDIGNILNMIRGVSTINQPITQSHVYTNSLTERKHIHIYTPSEVRYILNDHGFSDIEVSIYDLQHNFSNYSPAKRFNSWIRKLFYILPIYRSHMIIVSKLRDSGQEN